MVCHDRFNNETLLKADNFEKRLKVLIKSARYFKGTNASFKFISIRSRPRLYFRNNDIHNSNERNGYSFGRQSTK